MVKFEPCFRLALRLWRLLLGILPISAIYNFLWPSTLQAPQSRVQGQAADCSYLLHPPAHTVPMVTGFGVSADLRGSLGVLLYLLCLVCFRFLLP